MKHGIKTKKLNRTSTHRKAMLSNMAVSLVLHEQITTTLPKAKVIRPFVEKIVTLCKQGDLSARRKLFSILRSDIAVAKLMDIMSKRYEARQGGYLRIMKAGFRYGDMAPLAVIEFVDRDISSKGKDYGQLKVADVVVKESGLDKKSKSKTKATKATKSVSKTEAA